MAQNYDRECPVEACRVKHMKRYCPDGSAQKITKAEKKDLHPTKTRGELEAWRDAKEILRKRLKRPRSGRNRWVFRHWETIAKLARPPQYKYEATAIMRDGFKYTLKPEWGKKFVTCDEHYIPCQYSRPKVHQEHEADQLSQDVARGVRRRDGSLTDKAQREIESGFRQRDGRLSAKTRRDIAIGIRKGDGSLTEKGRNEIADEILLPDGSLRDDDRRNRVRPVKNVPVYDVPYANECELEIILHIARFRRVLEVGESPGCPLYSYADKKGVVRPHPDKLIDPGPRLLLPPKCSLLHAQIFLQIWIHVLAAAMSGTPKEKKTVKQQASNNTDGRVMSLMDDSWL